MNIMKLRSAGEMSQETQPRFEYIWNCDHLTTVACRACAYLVSLIYRVRNGRFYGQADVEPFELERNVCSQRENCPLSLFPL